VVVGAGAGWVGFMGDTEHQAHEPIDLMGLAHF
jgi:hypothetical protein